MEYAKAFSSHNDGTGRYQFIIARSHTVGQGLPFLHGTKKQKRGSGVAEAAAAL